MPQTVIGCDLAGSWIDTHVLTSGATTRIENTSEGVARWATSLGDDALFVFENEAEDGSVRGTDPPPNGGCDGPLIEALAGRGVRFARVNPQQAREFARALGVLAKTDRIDARILAEMGRMLPLEATAPPDPDRARLADLLCRRKQLVEMRHRPRRCAGTMRDSPRSYTRSRR